MQFVEWNRTFKNLMKKNSFSIFTHWFQTSQMWLQKHCELLIFQKWEKLSAKLRTMSQKGMIWQIDPLNCSMRFLKGPPKRPSLSSLLSAWKKTNETFWVCQKNHQDFTISFQKILRSMILCYQDFLIMVLNLLLPNQFRFYGQRT